MNVLPTLLHTERDWSALIMRLTLGIMILPHGAQKLLGWFGGFGFANTMAFFTDTMGIPWLLALAAILTEFFGGVALLAGFGTRVSAAFVMVVMGVAMFTTHLQHGFFMNWFGNQSGEGVEFFILAIGLAIAIMLRGGGSLATDSFLYNQLFIQQGEPV